MPNITNEEMALFKELLEERKKRQEAQKKKEKFTLEDWINITKLELSELHVEYGIIQSCAIEFVKLFKRVCLNDKITVVYFKFDSMMGYVTDECLERNSKGQIVLKKSFRDRLAEYGVGTKRDMKSNTIKIFLKRPKVRK